MTATLRPRRSPNRTDTDEVVGALLGKPTETWLHLNDLQDELGGRFARGSRLQRVLRYVEHCYGGLALSPLSGAYVRVTDLGRYLASDRTPCACGRCDGLGESERRR